MADAEPRLCTWRVLTTDLATERTCGQPAATHSSRCIDHRPNFPIESIDRLVGGWWVDRGGVLREHEAQWAAVRSYTEHHGTVESDGWVEVLDLERALAALARRHPLGAMAVMAVQMGFDQDELKAAFSSLRMPVSTLLKKSTAFMQAWLSGDVDRWERAEAAWKRARRREGLTPHD